MKKLALVLALILVLTFVGCSSGAVVKETDAFRFDPKTGYTCTAVPLGSSAAEFEKDIGSLMVLSEQGPVNAPFPYKTCMTNDAVQLADCLGKCEVQFDENDRLFSVTFIDYLARDTAAEHFEATRRRFTETFGEPVRSEDNGLGTQYLEWQDKKSGTALGITYSDLGTSDPSLLIGVFEKSRYVDLGIGEWEA